MSQINKVLDDYYAPIKLPDNNRDGLKADLHKAIMEVMPGKLEYLGCEVCDNFLTAEHNPWACQPTGKDYDGYCDNCKHHLENKCTKSKSELRSSDIYGYNNAIKEVEQAINKLFGGSYV